MATKPETPAPPVPAPEEAGGDGRHRRGERSRKRIVAAMFRLVRAGEVHPGAAQVAEAAQVSLRTVFRHFDEMDSLYREMTRLMEAEVLPIVGAPFTAPDWRGRLSELVARRSSIYERIMPLKVAAGVRRFQSAYLMADHRRFLALERDGLKDVLPKAVVARAVLFSALEAALGFQSWRRIRQDQGLSPEEAEQVLHFTVARLIDGV